MMPPSFVWWKLVLLAHFSFNFAQSDHLLGNSLGIGTTTDALSFPPLDGFNKNFLLIADDATNPPPSGELQHPSEVYSTNGQDPESSLMQTSNSKTNNDGCRVLGTTIDMLSSYIKKLLKRQGKFCPSPFLNLSPGAETEAGQQQQEALPVDVIQDLIAPAGAGSGLGKRPGQGKKKPGKDKKKGPPTNENRKLAPPEFEPEKKKCGNFAFDTYLVCGPLVGASPSLLDPLSVLLAGANPCMCYRPLLVFSLSPFPPCFPFFFFAAKNRLAFLDCPNDVARGPVFD